MVPNNATIVLNQSAAASANVGNVYADKIIRASFQIVATGTVNGTWKLQASNDYPVGKPAGQFVPTHWNDVASATATLAVAGVVMIPVQELSYAYLRIVFTDASGGSSTGTYTIQMNSIGF